LERGWPCCDSLIFAAAAALKSGDGGERTREKKRAREGQGREVGKERRGAGRANHFMCIIKNFLE